MAKKEIKKEDKELFRITYLDFLKQLKYYMLRWENREENPLSDSDRIKALWANLNYSRVQGYYEKYRNDPGKYNKMIAACMISPLAYKYRDQFKRQMEPGDLMDRSMKKPKSSHNSINVDEED